MARPAVSARALAVARGDEPADLLIRGGRILSVSARRWIDDSVAIADGCIVGWGDRDAIEVLDVDGAAITPGFVDAHMHLESTKLWVDEFVRAVLPHGTTAVAADPHEIANVFGVPGVAAVVDAAAGLPFTFGVCASSCVPASPFESSGAELGPADIALLIRDHGAIGVAEVMNFPGVISGDPDVRAKIATAGWRRVDGHAPGLGGRQLDAYLAAGVESDHECTLVAEAIEKRRKGMWVFIRQGSASQNLNELIPMVLEEGTDLVAFCTDDREPDTLRSVGHVNDCVRMAVASGVSEIDAIVMATTNPAIYHNMWHLGSLGPGYQADVLVFDSLAGWEPSLVLQRGRTVARDGLLVPGTIADTPVPDWMRGSVHLDQPPSATELTIELTDAASADGRVRIIGVTAGSLSTTHLEGDLTDATLDVARIGCVERHRSTGRIGLGYVSGFGLQRGAIASTVAHDAHNCMVIGGRGTDGPRSMEIAVARLAEMGGGQVVVDGERVVAEVRLPIGGLMSDRNAGDVADELETVVRAAATLGTSLPAPFMQLSFLGLSVIPQLRITDRGLIDVDRFEVTTVALLSHGELERAARHACRQRSRILATVSDTVPLLPTAPVWFRHALAVPFTDHTVEVSGARIHYLAWGTPGRRGIVFVHGGGAHAHWWTHVAARFAEEFRVVAIDLSGHGDSQHRDVYELEQWTEEVMAVASASGIDGPPVVVGHSMGGFVTIATAALHGDGLAGVIVCDSPVTEPDPEIEAHRLKQAFGHPRTYSSVDEAVSKFRTVPPQAEYLDYVMDYVARRSLRRVTGAEVTGWQWKFDRRVFEQFANQSMRGVALPYLRRVHCRFALLRSEHGLVTYDIGESMYETLGRLAPVIELPEAGHHAMLDQPLVLLTAIRTLLADWDHSVAAQRSSRS